MKYLSNSGILFVIFAFTSLFPSTGHAKIQDCYTAIQRYMSALEQDEAEFVNNTRPDFERCMKMEPRPWSTYPGPNQPIVKPDAPTEVRRVIETAFSLIGVPYRWAGTTPRGFDCSGFTGYVWNAVGYRLPRSSYEMAVVGMLIEKTDDLKPGDLLFFGRNKRRISHVGIYLGDGEFIHASSEAGYRQVTIDKLDGYYLKRFRFGRRLLE